MQVPHAALSVLFLTDKGFPLCSIEHTCVLEGVCQHVLLMRHCVALTSWSQVWPTYPLVLCNILVVTGIAAHENIPTKVDATECRLQLKLSKAMCIAHAHCTNLRDRRLNPPTMRRPQCLMRTCGCETLCSAADERTRLRS